MTDALVRFSCTIADHMVLREAKASPVLLTPDGLVAIDARVALQRTTGPTAPPQPESGERHG